MNKELLTRIEELETKVQRLEQLLELREDDTIYCPEPLEEELPEESEEFPESEDIIICREPDDEDIDQEIAREEEHE